MGSDSAEQLLSGSGQYQEGRKKVRTGLSMRAGEEVGENPLSWKVHLRKPHSHSHSIQLVRLWAVLHFVRFLGSLAFPHFSVLLRAVRFYSDAFPVIIATIEIFLAMLLGYPPHTSGIDFSPSSHLRPHADLILLVLHLSGLRRNNNLVNVDTQKRGKLVEILHEFQTVGTDAPIHATNEQCS